MSGALSGALSGACLGHHLGHVWDIIWACLGHHLGHVWGIILGTSDSLGHHLKACLGQSKISAVLHASLMPFLSSLAVLFNSRLAFSGQSHPFIHFHILWWSETDQGRLPGGWKWMKEDKSGWTWIKVDEIDKRGWKQMDVDDSWWKWMKMDESVWKGMPMFGVLDAVFSLWPLYIAVQYIGVGY